MSERKGFERLVNFTDAVVAIAATLLILPVVDAATSLGDHNADTFIEQVMPELFMFFLSFVVIANFWLEHHRLFRRLDKFDQPLMYYNFVWMVGIVVMPVPTALVVNGNSHDQISVAFYIGTMFVISLMQFFMTNHIHRYPQLEHGETATTMRWLGAMLSAIFLAIALVIGVTIPAIGLWALMIMFFIPVCVKIVHRFSAFSPQRR